MQDEKLVSSRFAMVKEAIAVQSLDQSAIENVITGDMSLLYGETSLESIKAILDSIASQAHVCVSGDNHVFIDVGCGRGHAVFGAAAAFRFDRYIGIELVQEHVDQANLALEKLVELENQHEIPLPTNKISFVCADAFDSDVAHEALRSATVVYFFDLAFGVDLRASFARLFAEILRDDTIVISTHLDPFPSEKFCPITDIFSFQAEWGAAPVRAYQKKPGAFTMWLEKHKLQLESKLPSDLQEKASIKMLESQFDIGHFVQLAQIEPKSLDLVVMATQDMKACSQVFIVDHAWTFLSRTDAVAALQGVPGLDERLVSICGSSYESAGDDNDSKASALLHALRELLGSYTLNDDGRTTTVYYLLDEVGSRIRHHKNGLVSQVQGDTPNMKMMPFYHKDLRLAFNLVWPITDISEGDILMCKHEQGWDLDEVDTQVKLESTDDLLPEMKEYASQQSLKNLIYQNNP